MAQTNGHDEPYWLGRATEEQQRLIKQHHIWTKAIGYLLHPSIAAVLPENARIADIGTGTGIWMTELAKVVPSTYTFNGYDISPDQFLPTDSLPSNVTLELGDFKKPIPEELRGKFDLVNIRLIIISMGVGVWEPTLQNILTLLKPGGAIQWTEGNFLEARGFRGASPSSTPGHFLTQGQKQFNGTLVKRFRWCFPPEWQKMYADAGLERIEEDVLSTDRLIEQRPDFTEIGIGAVFGALANLAKIKEEGYWNEQEVSEAKQKALEDRTSGAYLRWDLHVTIGFTKKDV
ncbi:S-adenosyl-L-methionine-dependent methyltransferase [Paraphaeosphaeria sporulosa]|uniref:S-adenosyl-L-methionine-dependent methyltransferase n=1 Tax=Paraphaeosphaeria sporulosa TaxID=1460663 RepID=A0A177CUN1_9PLEO|nr:S-adenosyl-L-methionine-dependent methyltransferase [Paraphaeosphaeria sporulosa]OAG10497.1 S-adenosyl-L-methionine-dependent methyltransferase [Paraphaeosphaeria sporulosa]